MNFYRYENNDDYYYIEAESIKQANKILLLQGIDYCKKPCKCCRNHKPKFSPYQKPLDTENFPSWEVEVYSDETNNELLEQREKEWYKKYGKYLVVKKPEWKQKYGGESFAGTIEFRNLEEYAKFLSEEYFYNNRIVYNNGKVINFNEEI